MNTKIFIASLIVSLALGFVTFLIGLSTLLPAPVAYFIVALFSGCLTAFWINNPTGASAPVKKPTQGSSKAQGSSRAQGSSKNESKPAKAPVKPSNKGKMETGSVKWFSASKGFGFITRDSGEDIFVHFRSILGKGHRILQDGQRVEYYVTTGDKGLQAEDVSPVK